MQITSAYLEAASTAYGHVRRNLLTAEQKNMENWTIEGNVVVEYDTERDLNTITIPQEVGEYQAPDGNFYKYYYYAKIRNISSYDEVRAYTNKPFAIDNQSGGRCWFYQYENGDYNLRQVFSPSNNNVHYFGQDMWIGTFKNGEQISYVLSVDFWSQGSSSYYETNVPKLTVSGSSAQKYWTVTTYLIAQSMRSITLYVDNVAQYDKDYDFMFDACTTTGATYMFGANTDKGIEYFFSTNDRQVLAWDLTQSSQLVEKTMTATCTAYRLTITFYFSELRNDAGNIVFEVQNLRLFVEED